MKAAALLALLVVVFGGAYLWFSHRQPSPTSPPVVAAPAAPAEDPRIVERRDRFGSEALAPDVQWRSSGLGFRISNAGTPPKPGIGVAVRLNYIGRLKDGTVFDRSDHPTEFLVGATIPGLSTGLQMLGTGGKAVFFIPPSLGYGNRKVLGIPPGSGLIFEVEVVSIAAP